MSDNIYNIGLLAGKVSKVDDYMSGLNYAEKIAHNFHDGVLGMIKGITDVKSRRERFTDDVAAITDIPAQVNAEEMSRFWLGYYHGRANSDKKPKGDGLTERFEMKLSPEQKGWLIDNGGAATLREMIDSKRSGKTAE